MVRQQLSPNDLVIKPNENPYILEPPYQKLIQFPPSSK